MSDANGVYRLEGEEETYRCRLDTNALAELEDELGYGVQKIGMTMAEGRMSFKDMRGLVWASLLHEDPELSLREAGDIVDDVQENMGWMDLLAEMTQALEVWLPDPDDIDEDEVKKAMKKMGVQSATSTETS